MANVLSMALRVRFKTLMDCGLCAAAGKTLLLSRATAARWGKKVRDGTLEVNLFPALRIVTGDDPGNETAPGLHILEVAAPAQQLGLLQTHLQMPVTAFDGTILMGNAAVVSGRLHAVIGTQCLKPFAQIFPRIRVQSDKGSRETVCAGITWHPAQLPQRVLQPTGQRSEALSTRHHFSMLPTGTDQSEVINAVRKGLASNRDGVLVFSGQRDAGRDQCATRCSS